ncbi:MAG: YtxH domain-containing protein [Acidimicrobiia bacterium]
MRFRTGVIVGFAVGYVLGAKAGRRRYEQIMAAFDRVRSSESVGKATRAAERRTRTPRGVAGNGLVNAAETIRAKASAAPQDQSESSR